MKIQAPSGQLDFHVDKRCHVKQLSQEDLTHTKGISSSVAKVMLLKFLPEFSNNNLTIVVGMHGDNILNESIQQFMVSNFSNWKLSENSNGTLIDRLQNKR